MSIRSIVGGFLVVLGCSTAVLSFAAMIMSMQMQTGTGLTIGLSAVGAAGLLLLVGFAVLLIRR